MIAMRLLVLALLVAGVFPACQCGDTFILMEQDGGDDLLNDSGFVDLGDAGESQDGGPAPDAGMPADAGDAPDAGAPFDAGPIADAGPPPEACDGGSFSWEATGDMKVPRERHSAVLLADGRVLISGGYGDMGAIASAEIFDPVAGDFTETAGELNEARYTHTSTLLDDGKVLLAGGFGTSSYLHTAEIFDPATGTFSTTDAMDQARTGHTATRLQDGKVIVVGGLNLGDDTAGPEQAEGQPARAEIYDPGAGTWAFSDAMGNPRYVHTAAPLDDGRVGVLGGLRIANGQNFLTSVEVYDPSGNDFSNATPLPLGVRSAALEQMADGRLVYTGGIGSGGATFSTVYVATSIDGPWNLNSSMGTGRFAHTLNGLDDNHLVIAGGVRAGDTTASAELVDLSGGAVYALPDMAAARLGHTATTLEDGTVLITGGNVDFNVHQDAELLVPACAP
jgi:hypothetical protein